MAIFCRELVNLATPFSHFFLPEIILSSRQSKSVDLTFGKVYLTETMTSLIVAWKFNKKWMEKSLFFTLNPLKLLSNQIHIRY